MAVIAMPNEGEPSSLHPKSTMSLADVYLRMFCHRFGLKFAVALFFMFFLALSLTTIVHSADSNGDVRVNRFETISEKFKKFQEMLDKQSNDLNEIEKVVREMSNQIKK